MRLLALLAALLWPALALATPGAWDRLTWTTGPASAPLVREAWVYEPLSRPPGNALPLVMAFHGGGGTALPFADRTGLAAAAEARGYVVVVPQGHEGSWNYGGQMTEAATRKAVDDMAFVSALMGALGPYNVHPTRRFVAGLSAGGMMAYRVACESPHRFRAIGAVASTMNVPTCPNAKGTSVLHIHGTADQNVPYAGGAGANSAAGANYRPVEAGLVDLYLANACGLPEIATRPTTDTEAWRYDCAAEAEVSLVLVTGGGHAWPGAEPTAAQTAAGEYVSPLYRATDRIFDFFDRH